MANALKETNPCISVYTILYTLFDLHKGSLNQLIKIISNVSAYVTDMYMVFHLKLHNYNDKSIIGGN